MKQHLLSLLALFLLLAAPLGAAQTISTTPVQVSVLSYQPVPAQAGDTLDLQLSVTNTGTQIAQRVEVEILASEIFTPEGRTMVGAGNIPSQSSFAARFNVRVSSTAEAGDRTLQVRTRQQGQEWQQHSVTIPIVSQQAAVLLTQVTSENIVPGERGSISLQIENLAGTTLRDIVVQLDFTNTPFSPAQSATQQRIDTLGAGTAHTVTYSINTDATATPADYAIPVTLRYLDSSSNQREDAETISARVESAPRTDAYVDLVERDGTDAIVRFRIINMGLSEIKFLQASIQEGEGYDTHPQSEKIYVGNVGSDDWETVRFTITPTQSDLSIPLTYTFLDAFNQEHTITQNYAVRVPQEENGSSAGIWIVLLLVLGVIGIIVYRKRNKNKKK